MYRLWGFYADMNIDGRITISDVWLWVKWLFFYPGDLIVDGIISYLPKIASFFEMDYSNYGGIASGCLSLAAWFIALCFIAGAVAANNSQET